MANVQECDLELCDFELQSWYYVHFWINTLRKDINTFTPLIMGWIVS